MADILIVDDDADLADTLAELLADLGHDVRVAREGCDGLSALDEGEFPDVIILDIEMPVLDGPGMAAQMFVRNCGREKIPIILISGYIGLRATADLVGTPYFAPKPCSIDTLLGLLERALHERTPPTPRATPELTAPGAPSPCEPSTTPESAPPLDGEDSSTQTPAEAKPPDRERE